MDKIQIHRLRRSIRHKQCRINKQLKKRLFPKENYPCCYCDVVIPTVQLTIEHKIPLSFGGNNDDRNIDLACCKCNNEKGKKDFIIKNEFKQR